jgi:hypothetical protein
MSSFLIVVMAIGLTGTVEGTSAVAQPVEPPSHQVVAIYFHRTVRCPTCKRIGTLAEEAVTKKFRKEIAAGTVGFQYVDYQHEQNAALVKTYKIEVPTLILTNAFDGKVVRWAPLPKVWQLVAKPDELATYVQDGVTKYLSQSKAQAESKE